METFTTPTGVRVVNDAYNANPESVAAALRAARWMAGGRSPDRGARARWPSSGRSRSRSTSASASSWPASRVDASHRGGPVGALDRDAPACARASSPRTSPATTTPTRRSTDVRPHRARPGRPRAREGLPRRGPRAARRGAAVISILVAAAVGLAVTLLGTPVAIRGFRAWGWGQRIREDGPHTHMEKMGTPTMGGIVILVALVAQLPRVAAHGGRLTVAGLALILAAVGFGAVGFLDDYMKVPTVDGRSGSRSHRSSSGPARGLGRVRAAGAHYSGAHGHGDAPVVHARHRDQARPVLPAVVLPGAHRVLERREPHRRARRPRGRLVDPRLAAYVVHRVLAVPPSVLRARDRRATAATR